MERNEALCALADMVLQFAYRTKFRNAEALANGGLSALEFAFGVLEGNGCKINSNGTIQVKNILAFMDKIENAET